MTTNIDYSITWIQVKDLNVIWRKAQRPFNPKWCQHIADEFDPDKFEPIIVTKPNGQGIYHIVEGQHRKGAMEILWGGSERVPCRIIAEADPARAAEIWLGINKGRKAIRPVQEFLVAVEANRDLEVAVNAIVKKAGYFVSDQTKTDNAISAVGALRKIYNLYGKETLYYTLQICRLLWGADPKGSSGAMMTGFAMFLNEWQKYIEAAHLRKVIVNQYKSPWGFLDAAKLESQKSSENLDYAMSELIRAKYNKSMRVESKKLKRRQRD